MFAWKVAAPGYLLISLVLVRVPTDFLNSSGFQISRSVDNTECSFGVVESPLNTNQRWVRLSLVHLTLMFATTVNLLKKCWITAFQVRWRYFPSHSQQSFFLHAEDGEIFKFWRDDHGRGNYALKNCKAIDIYGRQRTSECRLPHYVVGVWFWFWSRSTVRAIKVVSRLVRLFDPNWPIRLCDRWRSYSFDASRECIDSMLGRSVQSQR